MLSAMSKAAIIEGTTEYHQLMRQIVTNSLQSMAGYIAPTMAASEIQTTTVHENYLERVDPMMQALADDESLMNCNPRAPYLMLAWLLVGSDNRYRSCQYVEDMRHHKQVAIIHIRIASGYTPSEDEIKTILDATWDASLKADEVAATENIKNLARSAVGNPVRITQDASRKAAMESVREASRTTIRNKPYPSSTEAGKLAWLAASAAAGAVAWATDWDAAKALVAASARARIKNKSLLLAQIDDNEALSIARQLTIDILKLPTYQTSNS
jgi:hypothetical protein